MCVCRCVRVYVHVDMFGLTHVWMCSGTHVCMHVFMCLTAVSLQHPSLLLLLAVTSVIKAAVTNFLELPSCSNPLVFLNFRVWKCPICRPWTALCPRGTTVQHRGQAVSTLANKRSEGHIFPRVSRETLRGQRDGEGAQAW